MTSESFPPLMSLGETTNVVDYLVYSKCPAYLPVAAAESHLTPQPRKESKDRFFWTSRGEITKNVSWAGRRRNPPANGHTLNAPPPGESLACECPKCCWHFCSVTNWMLISFEAHDPGIFQGGMGPESCVLCPLLPAHNLTRA